LPALRHVHHCRAANLLDQSLEAGAVLIAN
jgi:hypothetical protein